MLIWLRQSKGAGDGEYAGVGVRDDVVRGDDLAKLVELDAAYHELNERCVALFNEARAQADAMLAAAEAEANELVDQAQTFYASAYQTGYEAGWQEALTAWHEKNMQKQAGRPSIGQRQRERLAQLVAMAVERIVYSADPVALFRQAATHVDGIVADGSPLKVRVHPDDLTAAAAAFDDISRTWRESGRSVRLQVSGDPQLERGACLCEADLGAVDASLPQQLDAINAALARAVQSMPVDDADDADDGEEIDEAPQVHAAPGRQVRPGAATDDTAHARRAEPAYAEAPPQPDAPAYPDQADQADQSDQAGYNPAYNPSYSQTASPDLSDEQDFFADAAASIDGPGGSGHPEPGAELEAGAFDTA